MAMNLAKVSQSSIGKAAGESGLSLTTDQVQDIAEAESACLAECGRVSFGEIAAARIARELGASPFVSEDNAVEALVKLTEAFYEIREDYPASITDIQIIESLGEAFDGDAAGDAGLACSLAGEALAKRMGYSTYEIADDDGNVYRWESEEWHDDITADGWYGERWEDADE